MSTHAASSPAQRAHGVADLFRGDRPAVVPRRPARRGHLMGYPAATLFSGGCVCNERDVDQALAAVHDDTAALRRYLVESGFLGRTRDGSVHQCLR